MGSRWERYEYDGEGALALVVTDAGVSTRYHRTSFEVLEAVFGVPVAGQKARVLPRVISIDPETKLPTSYATVGQTKWEFEWEDGRVVGERGPRGARRYRYDAAGRLKSWSDDSGREVLSSRSGADLRIASSEGDLITLTLDARGTPRAVSHQGEPELQFGISAEGRLESATSRHGTLRYEGGPKSRSLVTPWGTTCWTSEDVFAGERVSRVETPAGAFQFSYGDDGVRTELRYPNGVVARYRYGDAQTLTRLESSALTLDQTWDARFLLQRQVRDGDARDSAAFSYDAFGRLVRIAQRGKVRRFIPDFAGNRGMEEVEPGVFVSDQVHPDLRLKDRVVLRRSPAGKWTLGETLARYTSDRAGRLLEIAPTSGGVDRFRYDGFGRLSEVQRAGSPRVRYRYDGLGRLALREVGEGTKSAVTRYAYDGLRLLAELGPGGRLRVYAHGPDLDEPLAYRDGEGPWIYLHGDERGSVLAYSDAEGRRVDRVHFSPFGVLKKGPRSDRPLFFAGHRYDPIAQLVLARARAYDPALNRFLGPDPAGVRDGINPFQYANANPLSNVDPLGLWAQPGTIRSHYGALSPRAQLLLLHRIQSLRLSPNPKAPLVSLFGNVFPELRGESGDETGDETGGETRVGFRAASELANDVALADDVADAQATLASPAGEEVRATVTEAQWRLFEKIAAIEDPAERAQDGELLRELVAPTRAEEALKARDVRRLRLSVELGEKHLGSKFGPVAEFLAGIEAPLHAIDKAELLGKLAEHLPGMDNAELREALEEIERLTDSSGVAARVEAEAPKRRRSPTVREWALERRNFYLHRAETQKRFALRDARRARRALWKEHRQVLSSLEAVRAGLALRPAEDLTDLIKELYLEERAAGKKAGVAELALRRALVVPLGHAEYYGRVLKDRRVYEGKSTPAILRLSWSLGKERALFGKLPLARDHQNADARPLDYLARLRALEELEYQEGVERAVRKRVEAQRTKRLAKAAAKRRARRGRPRGVT
ncbi:MAG: RHS repeat-associated core domain-containing protein, partial [Planctomycetes bacterium]|nr:RHS repeat-associated core domain-containing protein [Planctomycetota bacterium]